MSAMACAAVNNAACQAAMMNGCGMKFRIGGCGLLTGVRKGRCLGGLRLWLRLWLRLSRILQWPGCGSAENVSCTR